MVDECVRGGRPSAFSDASYRRFARPSTFLVITAVIDAGALAVGVSLGWLEEANPIMAPVVSWLSRSRCLWILPLLKGCYCAALVLLLGRAREAALRCNRMTTVRMADAAIWISLAAQAFAAFLSLALLAYCYHARYD